MSEFVRDAQRPDHLCQREMRHPCASFDECVCPRALILVIARNDAHQNVRINGAHASRECTGRSLPSTLRVFEVLEALEKERDGCLRTCSGPPAGPSPCRPPPPTPESSRERCPSCAGFRL